MASCMKCPDCYMKCQWVYLHPQAKHCLLYSMVLYGIAPNGLPQAGLGHLYFLAYSSSRSCNCCWTVVPTLPFMKKYTAMDKAATIMTMRMAGSMPGIKPRHIPDMDNMPCKRCLLADFAALFCISILRLSYSSHTVFIGFSENVGTSFCEPSTSPVETSANFSIYCRGTRNFSSPNCTRLVGVIALRIIWLPSTKVIFWSLVFSMLI